MPKVGNVRFPLPIKGENKCHVIASDIARTARLKWGTAAATRAEIDWIISGYGHTPADLRRDPRARRRFGLRERRQ